MQIGVLLLTRLPGAGQQCELKASCTALHCGCPLMDCLPGVACKGRHWFPRAVRGFCCTAFNCRRCGTGATAATGKPAPPWQHGKHSGRKATEQAGGCGRRHRRDGRTVWNSDQMCNITSSVPDAFLSCVNTFAEQSCSAPQNLTLHHHDAASAAVQRLWVQSMCTMGPSTHGLAVSRRNWCLAWPADGAWAGL